MALLFAEGFEHYGVTSTGNSNMLAGEYVELNVNVFPNTDQARTGSRALRIGNNLTNWTWRKNHGSQHNELGAGLGLYISQLNNPTSIISFASGNSISTGVLLNVAPDGSIVVAKGLSSGNRQVLGTSDPGIISAQTWNHIEFRVLNDPVVGEIEVRLNGEVVLLLTNLELFSSTLGSVGCYSYTSPTPLYYIDDLIVWDTTGDVNNTFFGPARVAYIGLKGDESGNQWSVTGAATGADALTEVAPDGDTSYISAAIIGMVSEFGIDELPPEAELIAGIYVTAMGKLATAGVGNCQISIVSNGQVQSGTDDPLTTAYTYRGNVFEKDPNTGLLWTKGGLEAAKLKFEKTA
jgi:hypothetical protein